MRQHQEINNNEDEGVLRKASVSLFASPEAAKARALLDRGDDVNNLEGDMMNGDVSKPHGIDVPLSEISNANHLRKKDKDLESIVRTYSACATPGKPVPAAHSRWRKLQICASLCAKLENDMNDKPLKTNSESHKPLFPTPDGSSKTRARSRSFSPRPSSYQSAVGKTTKFTTSEDYSKNHLKPNSENQQHLPCRPQTPSPRMPRLQFGARKITNVSVPKEELEIDDKVNPLKPSSDFQKRSSSNAHGRPMSPFPRQLKQTVSGKKVNPSITVEDLEPEAKVVPSNASQSDSSPNASHLSPENICRPSSPLAPRRVMKQDPVLSDGLDIEKDENNNDCQDDKDGERNYQQSSRAEVGDDKEESCETFPDELLNFRRSSRFNRRSSLPANINMGGSKPHQLLPTPPLHSARFQVSNNSNTSPVSRRHWVKFEQNGHSMRRRSDSSLIDQERNLSLRSNLEVNRAIVSELIQQRSTVISQLNSDTNSSSEDVAAIPGGESPRPRAMIPMMGRLLDRRASSGCASSIHEFNERRVSPTFPYT